MYQIIIQQVAKKNNCPKTNALRKWVKATLKDRITDAEITIRIVDKDEMTLLNKQYRHKDGPTNVLSFPFVMHQSIELETPILGDIVICADVVNEEAHQQNKSELEHWAHMTVHGIFHLLGYDHQTDTEAEEMEALEIKVLHQLGFPNPYHIGD